MPAEACVRIGGCSIQSEGAPSRGVLGRACNTRAVSTSLFPWLVDWPLSRCTLVYMDKDLHRRLMPHPKGSGTLATALPAAPALVPVVHMQVLRGERMPFATRLRYLLRKRAVEQLRGLGEAHNTS